MTASPVKLVVIVFDHLLANLHRARLAIDAKRIEARIEAAGKARDAVLELLASTDVERGGELAQNLRSLYVFMFGELAEVVLRAGCQARRPTDGDRRRPARRVRTTIAASPSIHTPAA